MPRRSIAVARSGDSNSTGLWFRSAVPGPVFQDQACSPALYAGQAAALGREPEESLSMARAGLCPSGEWGSCSPAAWSAREIESQVLATLAALAQISTPSAAHFLKSHQLLVQKFAADRDRQKKPRLPFDRDCPAHTLQRSQARSQRFQTWNGAIGLRDNNSPVLPFDRSTKTRTDASVTIRLLISTPTQRVSHI
jgi:hypothetical protein